MKRYVKATSSDRLLDRIQHWTDAYKEFNKIADEYFPDEDLINKNVESLYTKYKGNRYFDQAYAKWTDNPEMYIPTDSEKPFVVHYGFDIGDAESGPLIRDDSDIMYATSAEEAEDNWMKLYGDENLAGCWAEPATAEDLQKAEYF